MNLFPKAGTNQTAGKKKKQSDTKDFWKDIRKFTLTVLKIVVVSILALCFFAGGAVGGAILGYIKTTAPLNPEDFITKTETSYVYDADGNQIAELTGAENKNMVQVSYDEVPKYLKDAIIAIEDERFEEHPGIDLRRIFSAVISAVMNSGEAEHGASTITQQVVKNITGNTKRSLARKVQEQWTALQLEKRYTKWEILEKYMNIIYMGYNYYGVESASKAYFGKHVSDLSLAECALLAGITNLPGKYNPFTTKGRENAIARQKTILEKMLELGKITQDEYEQALNEELKFMEPSDSNKNTSSQTYFVDQVILDVAKDLAKEKGISEVEARRRIYNYGYKIYTTQDSRMQQAMDEVFTDETYFPVLDKNGNPINKNAAKYDEIPQAAMVIIDPFTGHIKAMYGGHGEKTKNLAFNRATQAKRQPGSSIKPIAVYGPALDLKLITPATVYDDTVSHMDPKNPEKRWPQNSDTTSYEGLTSIRFAIKSSVNVVATKVLRDTLGFDNTFDYLEKAGVQLDRNKDRNLAMALGGITDGVTPLQMAAAYVPFANQGLYYTPTTYTKVTDRDGKVILEKTQEYNIVYEEATAFLMADMMQEVTRGRVSTYPNGGTAASRISIQDKKMPVAGKTGTTSDNVDKWFVGYTPYYVASAWYGYDNKTKKIVLESGERNQAQIIWNAVMQKVHEGLEPKQFPVPSDVVKSTICIYSGKLATDLCTHDSRGNATMEQYFLKGTEPRYDETCDVHVTAKVCTDSKDIWGRNLLAGENCPQSSVIEKTFIHRLQPYTPQVPGDPYPEDWKYELPDGEYCTIHGAPGSTSISPPSTNTNTPEDPSVPATLPDTGIDANAGDDSGIHDQLNTTTDTGNSD